MGEPPEHSEPAYFRGPFTEAERSVLEAALEVLSRRQVSSSSAARPWLIVKEQVHETKVFIAHRLLDGYIFAAKTAEELAHKIINAPRTWQF